MKLQLTDGKNRSSKYLCVNMSGEFNVHIS